MFEWLFGYPITTFQRSEWAFASAWGLPSLYALLVAAALLIAALLVFSKTSLSPVHRAVVGTLQWLVVAVILLLLWQPILVTERLKPNENSVALMLDTSQSMAYDDGAELRIDVARDLLLGSPIEQIEATYRTDKYVFANSAIQIEAFDLLPEPGPQTRLADSLLEVLERAKAQSLAAIVVFSDGAESGGVLSPDQLAEITAFGVPVHTVGIGQEAIAEDIELQSLVVPDKVLPNTLVTAEATIRHDAPGKVRLKVYSGEEFLAAREIDLSETAQTTNARIEFDMGDAGFEELSFQLDPIEGEKNLENNQRTHLLEVADQKYSVLYIEGEPRWEYKYIRRALTDDPTTRLATLLWVSDNKFYRQGIEDASQLETGFPRDRQALFSYDAIVIGSIEAPRLTSDQQQLIYEFVSDRGGSLLMLGGRNGLAAGGWGNTMVGDLLPVRIEDIDPSFVNTRAQALLTPQGSSTAFLTFDETADANAERWQNLPSLASYQKLGTLRPAAATLLNARPEGASQTETLPLLVSQPYGKGRSYVFATGGTWRWQMGMPAEDDSHETFWRQLMRALVVNSPGKMSFTVETEGDELKMIAEVRDDDYQPMDDVRVLAVISSDQPANAALASSGIELSASQDKAGRYEARVMLADSGTYFVDAIASFGDEPLDAARVAIHRADVDAESFGIRQDRTQLERIADVTGGRYWTADTLDDLPQQLENSSAGIVEQIRHPLWGVPAAFILLIMIKLTEWLLRRRWGHI